MKQIFISYRAQALPRWREAFIDADIRLNFDSSTTFPEMPSEKSVVWLHVPPESEDLAKRIGNVRYMASGSPVVVLSNLPSEAEGLEVFAAGASGYCNALAIPELLRQVAAVVAQGGLWVGQDLVKRLFGGMSDHATPAVTAQTLAELSAREAQVAQAVARGATNKEIARALNITERTVKAHLSAIFEKLNVRDRLQLSLVVNGVESPSDQHNNIST